MRISRLAHYYRGTLSQTFECDLCDAAVTEQAATDIKGQLLVQRTKRMELNYGDERERTRAVAYP